MMKGFLYKQKVQAMESDILDLQFINSVTSGNIFKSSKFQFLSLNNEKNNT